MFLSLSVSRHRFFRGLSSTAITLGTRVVGLKAKRVVPGGNSKTGRSRFVFGIEVRVFIYIYSKPADLGICQFCRRHVRVGTGHRRDNPPGGVAEVNVKATPKGYPPTL